MQINVDVHNSVPSTTDVIEFDAAQQSSGRLIVNFSESHPFIYEGPSIVLILNELEICFEKILNDNEIQPILVLFAPIALMVQQNGKVLVSTGNPENFHDKIIDEMPLEDARDILKMLQRLVTKYGRLERNPSNTI